MSRFTDKLDRSEKAPKPHRDVDVCLDDDTGDRLDALEQQVEDLKADIRLGDPRPAQLREQIDAVQAEAAEAMVTLRFRRLAPEDWADIIARSPQRLDVPADRLYGYNVHDASRTAAPLSGTVLERPADGGDPVEETPTEDDWERLFAQLSGRDFNRICDAVFDLNDYDAKRRLDAARKASRVSTGTSSNSPSDSGEPPAS